MLRLFIITAVFFSLSCPLHAYQPAVVSANAQASKVGMEILEKGGSAADAAIATAFALSVTEPGNSGLGGGGFFLYYDAKLDEFYFLDYREVAPRAVHPKYYEDTSLLSEGIRSIAVPGFLLGMEAIHKKWRRVSWPAVIEPSIKLAKKGVPLEGLFRDHLGGALDKLDKDTEAQRLLVYPYKKNHNSVYFDDLARTLEEIKTGGADFFYRGVLGKKMAQWMKDEGGLITEDDLKNYQVNFRKPFTFEYGKYKIISAPPPSSGGQGLKLLFRRVIIYGLEHAASNSPNTYEKLLQSLKDYFDFRGIAIRDTRANIISHTTHLSVIDREGNMAAMTNTLNFHFGSGRILPGTGIVMNNEMADFSLKAGAVNFIRPGARPTSSMSPTIVYKDDKPQLIIGTPGGLTIPQNLFQIFYYQWVWKYPLAKAIEQPKFYYSPQNQDIVVEKKLQKRIRRYLSGGDGKSMREEDSIGNVQALWIKSSAKTLPYSDPRGEGSAVVGAVE